jgi:hypothetical protein
MWKAGRLAIWVGEGDRPARLRLTRAEWHIQVRFERVSFSPSLPPHTWQPAEGEDAIEILADALQAAAGLD